jgi:hypothetical protein
MTQPRSPRPKRATNGTRASRRHVRDMAWIQAELLKRFTRMAEMLEANRQKELADGTPGVLDFNINRQSPKEKAPGLATEGFSSFFREKETPSG